MVIVLTKVWNKEGFRKQNNEFFKKILPSMKILQ
jgi:hypothetical protein